MDVLDLELNLTAFDIGGDENVRKTNYISYNIYHNIC